MKVLFLCSGNICRSPMAAAYLRACVVRDGMKGLVVDSAGTLGIRGAPASPEAVQAMKEIGVDLSAHRSKGLKRSDLVGTKLVVGMSYDHLEYLARRHPGGRDERLLLRAFERAARPDPNPHDLDDPIGHPVAFYRDQVSIIRRCVENLILYLGLR